MGHLSKLQDEFGGQGLHVIAVTGEDKAVNLRYMVHDDPGFTFKVAIGAAPGYELPGLPYAFLIDPDGNIVYRGSPSGLSRKRVLLPALARVRAPTAPEIAARSQKMYDFAAAFATDRMYLRAEIAFDELIETYPGSAAAAAARERKGALLEADGAAAEYAAQKAIARIVGGVEAPDPRGKKRKRKQIAAAAKQLDGLADGLTGKAPRSAALAAFWAEIFHTPWE